MLRWYEEAKQALLVCRQIWRNKYAPWHILCSRNLHNRNYCNKLLLCSYLKVSFNKCSHLRLRPCCSFPLSLFIHRCYRRERRGVENHLKYHFNDIRLSCSASDKNAINYGGNLLIVSDAAAAANKFSHGFETFFHYYSRFRLTSHNGRTAVAGAGV